MIGRTSPPFPTSEKKSMPERATEVKDKIVAHVKENKWAYLAGGAGLIGGVLIAPKQIVIVDALKGLQWKSPAANTVTAVLARRGQPGYIIKCNETGEVFASQNRAAQAMDVNPAHLSQHLQGRWPAVKGYTFERLGEAS
jgi:hypothetical protein